MKTGLLTALIVAMAAVGRCAAGPEDAVVRVTATRRFPDLTRPWAKLGPVETSGTGVVIPGGKILTCAHPVTYATDVTVQGREGGRRADARVEAVGLGIDLAVLAPTDPEFLADRPPLPRSKELPRAMAPVLVYGYPVGGSELSVTKGIVSRVGFGSYDGGGMGLRLQVDAAINPGNSGGPALVEGQMVGLACSRQAGTQGIGYILPCEEIDAFLDDIKDGRYDDKATLPGEYQALENDALRARLGLARDSGGMMIRRPDPRMAGLLREFDVLARIGDRPIDREGMVQVRDGLRLPFLYLVPSVESGGAVPMQVWRDGRPVKLDLPVRHRDDALIRGLDGREPRFFLVGPLAFSAVVAETAGVCLNLDPSLVARHSPLVMRSVDRARSEGDELVAVATPLIPHRSARGYEDPAGQVLESVDGVPIRSLLHLVEVLRDGRGEYVTFRFAEDDAETLVFRLSELETATSEVMSENGIPRRGSPDVLAAWAGRPPGVR